MGENEIRVFLLKFLCDEVLNSVLVREHLDQCTDRSTDLHQKLRSLTVEWRNLKVKEEMLAMRTIKDHTRKTVGVEGILKEDSVTAMIATHGRLLEQRPNCSNKMHDSSISTLNDMPMQLESSLEESGQFDTHTSLILKSANVKHANGNLSRTCSPSSTSFADSATAADVELATSNVVLNFSAEKDNRAPEEVVQNSEHREHMPISVIHDSSIKKSINNVENNESFQPNADTVIGNCLFSENGGTNLHNHTITIPSSCGEKISRHNSLTFHQTATFQGNVMNINFNVVDSDNCDLDLNSLKQEILQLQVSVASLESQLMMASLRREFLGKDSHDQLYWIIGRPGKRSWLVVDRSMLFAQERRLKKETRDRECKISLGSSDPVIKRKASSDLFSCNDTIDYGLHVSASGSSPIVQFESDSELEELVGWLRDSNSRERELKECILLWRRLRFSPENVFAPCESQLTSNKSSIYEERAVPLSLNTKAANVLEMKHGPFLEIEINGNPKRRGKKAKISHDDRMYRCECLEPVWPSRQHCISCHQTFSTLFELEVHNDGKCNSSNPAADEGKEIDELLKTKGVRWEASQEKEHYDGLDTSESVKNGKWDVSLNLVNFQRRCPYDLNEVSKRFITNNSNKELVKEIGLIGSNGVPSLVPGCSLQFLDPTLIFDQNKLKNATMNEGYSNQIETISKDITQDDTGKVCKNISGVLQNGHGDSHEESLLKIEGPASSHAEVQRTSPAFKSENCKGAQSYTIPEPSLRPLVGKISQIVKRLKMNLLDMDAALPGEAIKPSKASLIRRCVWRMFVKSAESIYEPLVYILVQATVLFEDMIKTDYLKNGWWYWSSLTAAARTPSISALALRVYALDDSIIYFKDPSGSLDPDSQQLITRVGRKRKDMEGGGRPANCLVQFMRLRLFMHRPRLGWFPLFAREIADLVCYCELNEKCFQTIFWILFLTSQRPKKRWPAHSIKIGEIAQVNAGDSGMVVGSSSNRLSFGIKTMVKSAGGLSPSMTTRGGDLNIAACDG
ncbi:Methyl-CpG-binding domain-containing protein 9 [Platanthera guangdongensis]|uniref:Methyl-CpG-binding domain-containing protein 9 n=1 Tax=Platanthera guangdongensis TaxID=2320717 RepID=A0ABR2MF78_9ASPA